MPRVIHKHKGYVIVPDTEGRAVSWRRLTVPPKYMLRLGIAEVKEEFPAQFFHTLELARGFIDKLLTGEVT